MGTEIRALRDTELEAHADLVFRSYRAGRDLAADSMLMQPDWWLRSIRREPGYACEQTRVLVLDGRLAASVTCFMRPSYVAGRVVPMVCIGSVCTDPDYRRRGLVRQVLAEAVQWMGSQGIVWSFLFGLESIYGGSGWRNLATWNTTVNLQIRDDLAAGLSSRVADPDRDVPCLAALHDAFSGRQTGPLRRSREFWQRRVLAVPGPWAAAPTYTLLETGGHPVGYYCGSDGQVTDVAWAEGQGPAVLAHLLRRGSGRAVTFPFFTRELAACLRAVSAIPAQADCLNHPGNVTLTETYRGLWRFLQDRAALFPEVRDTDSLLRFLRVHDYTYWPADRA